MSWKIMLTTFTVRLLSLICTILQRHFAMTVDERSKAYIQPTAAPWHWVLVGQDAPRLTK